MTDRQRDTLVEMVQRLAVAADRLGTCEGADAEEHRAIADSSMDVLWSVAQLVVVVQMDREAV